MSIWSSHRLTFGAVLCGLVVTCVAPSSSIAGAREALPRRLCYLPQEFHPVDDEKATWRLDADTMRLPDERWAQRIRLQFWVKVSEGSAARVAWDYVGVESAEQFRWGGGPVTAQWSSRLGRPFGRSLALDLSAQLPHGDDELLPFSAKAPMAEVRVRLAALSAGSWDVWTGWWARRVSPPSDLPTGVAPSYFRSGSGWEIVLRRVGERAETEARVGRPLGGYPSATAVHLFTDLPLSSDLAIRLGGMLSLGPAEDRSLDHGVRLGLVWRPPHRESQPETEGGGRTF